jgi:hypothetical protein
VEQDVGRLQIAFEVGDQVRREMKPHPVGVEKRQAAVTPVEVRNGDRGPVVLLILRTVRRQRLSIGIVIKALPLAKTDAVPEDDPGESSPDLAQDALLVLSHGTQH